MFTGHIYLEPDHTIVDLPEKNNAWDDRLPHHQRACKHSLSDEMEAHELPDADFPGEEGAEVTIDETTGDILTLNI